MTTTCTRCEGTGFLNIHQLEDDPSPASVVQGVASIVARNAELEAEGTDGPAYNAGRIEGHADVCAELRRIIDPSDSKHWNKDGLLAEVERLKGEDAGAVAVSDTGAQVDALAWSDIGISVYGLRPVEGE